MPRIAEGRPPAEPASPEQWARYRRILRSAINHGIRQPLDRVQMTEVAKDAGVAIATLYRYFPSKTQLFASVLHGQVGTLDRMVQPRSDVSPDVAVAELLIGAGRALLRWPHLAQSMLNSNLVVTHNDNDVRVAVAFRSMLARVAGLTEVTDLDRRLIWIVEQSWYGMLVSALNGVVTPDEVEADVRLACARLLSDLGRCDPIPSRTRPHALPAGV